MTAEDREILWNALWQPGVLLELAILAACLGRLGDARALPALNLLAEDEGIRYLDYIELRSAIEALGGEAPRREFYGDSEYEALFSTRSE